MQPSYLRLQSRQTWLVLPRLVSCQDDTHVVPPTERLAAARALAAAVRNKVFDAGLAKDMPAKLDDCVADVGIADGADG